MFVHYLNFIFNTNQLYRKIIRKYKCKTTTMEVPYRLRLFKLYRLQTPLGIGNTYFITSSLLQS